MLEWGENSPYAAFFDINWDPTRDDLKGRVLLPVLGDQYGAVLESGEIALRFDPAEGNFSAWYYEHRFPISRCPTPTSCGAAAPALSQVGRRFRRAAAADRRARRARRPLELKRRLAAAACRSRRRPRRIEAALRRLRRAIPAMPASFRRLHRLLEEQAYRVAVLARRDRGDQLSPVFQHQRPGRAAHRIAGAVRGDAPADLRAGRGRARCRGCASTISTGCSTRPPIAPSCASGPARRPTRRRKDPGALRAAARLADRGHAPATISSTRCSALFVDPGGGGGDDPPLPPRHRASRREFRRGAVRREAAHHAGQPGERDERARPPLSSPVGRATGAPATSPCAACSARSRRSSRPFRSTAPMSRRAGAAADDRRYIDWAVGQAKKRWRPSDTTILDFIHGVLVADLTGHPLPETCCAPRCSSSR